MTESRPAGATLLSILHIAGGGALLVGTFFTVAHDRKLPLWPFQDAVPQWYLIIALTILGVWSFGAGIELWITRLSGWQLGSSFHLHLAAQFGVLVTQGIMGNDYMLRSSMAWLILQGAIAVISLGIYLYFWKYDVLESYDMEHTGIVHRLGPGLLVTVIMVAAAHFGYLNVRTAHGEPGTAPVIDVQPVRPLNNVDPASIEDARAWMQNVLAAMNDDAEMLPVADRLAIGPVLWSDLALGTTLDEASYASVKLSDIGFGATNVLEAAVVPIQEVITPDAQTRFWQAVKERMWPETMTPELRVANESERQLLKTLVPLSWRGKPLLIIDHGLQRVVIAFQLREGGNWEAHFVELLPPRITELAPRSEEDSRRIGPDAGTQTPNTLPTPPPVP